jgi:uncharacterized protein YhfF
MSERTPACEAFWRSCRERLPELADVSHYDVWRFGDSAALCDELLALVLEGRKTATAGLLWEYEGGSEPAPRLGGYSVVAGSRGEPACLLQTIEVRTLAYIEVPADFAYDEGEGDRSLASWRRAHWDYFTRRCEALGRTPDERMPVVCERFRLVCPLPATAHRRDESRRS